MFLDSGASIPFGAEKWITFPSVLNMLTSSMAWMGWTLSFLSAPWSFLSSVPALLCTFLTFLRGVPLPLFAAVSHCPHVYCQHPIRSRVSGGGVRWLGERHIQWRGRATGRAGQKTKAYPVSHVSPQVCGSAQQSARGRAQLRAETEQTGGTYQCAPTAACAPALLDPYLRWGEKMRRHGGFTARATSAVGR